MKWFSSSSCYAFAADGAIAIKRHLADALAVDFGCLDAVADGPVSESVSVDSDSDSDSDSGSDSASDSDSDSYSAGCFRVGSCKLWWGDERSVIDLLLLWLYAVGQNPPSTRTVCLAKLSALA